MGRPVWNRLRIASAVPIWALVVNGHSDGHATLHGATDHPLYTHPPLGHINGSQDASTYFRYPGSASWMTAHIIVMTISWVFVLPLAVMLSIPQSHLSFPMQCLFAVLNVAGLVCGIVYSARTPDLYPNNIHRTAGWLISWLSIAYIFLGIANAYARQRAAVRAIFMPVSTAAMVACQRRYELETTETTYSRRFSSDSGQGTERNTESLRSNSISSTGNEENQMAYNGAILDIQSLEHGSRPLLGRCTRDSYFSTGVARWSGRLMHSCRICCSATARIMPLIGFTGLTTGWVIYGGFAKGDNIRSSLAHLIKGGIFFWYGILTLGRWAGSFADIGWSWNVKPPTPDNSRWISAAPSAGFVESFMIFVYGVSQFFFENSYEHISITILFFGGGLCGMLVESTRARRLLNSGVGPVLDDHYQERSPPEPRSYQISMNPIPALVIFLLGMIMSSHHHANMYSTMIHKQWGDLLTGAALARGATYLLLYLSPPTSAYPGRPPTELVTTFCLMAGGLMFMASADDTITALQDYGLSAMSVFMAVTGLIMFLMFWIVWLIMMKAWATRKKHSTQSTS